MIWPPKPRTPSISGTAPPGICTGIGGCGELSVVPSSDWVMIHQLLSGMAIQSKLPSGELTFCHGKSPFLMGKSTISMAIFNCYVSSPEGSIHHARSIKESGGPCFLAFEKKAKKRTNKQPSNISSVFWDISYKYHLFVGASSLIGNSRQIKGLTREISRHTSS